MDFIKAQDNKVRFGVGSDLTLLAVTLLFFLLLFFMGRPMFEVNDDMTIIGILSGRYGQPSPDGIFISALLSRLFYILYQLNTQIPWFSLTLYLCHLISLFLGLKIIKSLPGSLLDKGLAILALLSLYCYIFYRLSFTSTSLLLWFMSALYISYLNLSGRAVNWLDLFPGVLLVISYLIRPDMLKLALAFSLPLTLSFLLPGVKKRLVYILVPVLLLGAVSFFLESNKMSTHYAGADYKELQAARNLLVATKSGEYNQNTPQALKMAGWTLEDFKLAGEWWTHDESIYNKHKIEEFLRFNQSSDSSFFSMLSLDKGLEGLELVEVYLFILGLGLVLLLMIKNEPMPYDIPFAFLKTSRIVGLLVLGMLIGGFCLMACIRFPMRIALPLLIYLLGLLIILVPISPFRLPRSNLIIAMVASALLLCGFYNLWLLKQESDFRMQVKQYTNDSIKLVQRLNGRDTILVNPTPWALYMEAAHPLLEYRDIPDFNQAPNGWLVGSPVYYNYLRQLGLTSGREFCLYTINNDKVVFAFMDSDTLVFSQFIDCFIQHFSHHYSAYLQGSKLVVEVVADRRAVYANNIKYGWIYYKIKSVEK